MYRIVCFVTFLAAVGFAADRAAAAERRSRPLTKLELRHSPQEKIKRRILEQLSEALVLPDQSRSKRPVRPLDEVWLFTRAYGTATPGLCRSDRVVVTFSPVGPEKGAATPVRLTGLRTVRRYRLLRDVRPEEAGSLDHDGRIAADAECAAIDVVNTHFILTDFNDEFGAESWFVQAMWYLPRVIAHAASIADLPFELRCTGDLEGKVDLCRKELARIDPETMLINVDKCNSLKKDGASLSCRFYGAWNDDSEVSHSLGILIYTDGSGKVAVVSVDSQFVLVEQVLD